MERLRADIPLCERPYGMQEALEGYKRAATTHGWKVRNDILIHRILLLIDIFQIPDTVYRIAAY